MPVIMRPSANNKDEVLDAERLRQIARRKEQNRNAQRRLRERKEEYTMQLEAQLAELHRRSQSQEEESHFLREALARMRAENQTLAEQIAMIHQAVPSTQTSHPLPQRASIDLGIDLFAHTASLNRNRNRSQSATASTMPHFAFSHAAAPWSTAASQHTMPAMHAPFGATIAPGATHRLPFPSVSTLPGASSHAGGLTMPQNEPMEDVAMPRFEDHSRRSSISPISQRRDSTLISPFDSKRNLSRHGSDGTELTMPTEHSDSESNPSTKIQRTSASSTTHATSMAPSPSPSLGSAPIPSRTMASTVAHAGLDQRGEANTAVSSMPPTSDDVMASCLESIHSLGGAEALKQSEANISQKPGFDSAATWMSSATDMPGQLALPDFRQSDLSTAPKPLGLTPGALGLSNLMPGSGAGGDGWSISPWIHLSQTPSAGASADMEATSSRTHVENQFTENGIGFDSRKSLASRRGFSGSLKLETRAA